MKLLTIALQTVILAAVTAAVGVLVILLQGKPAEHPHGVFPVVYVVPLLFFLATLALTVSVPMALWVLVWRRELRTRMSIGIAIRGTGLLVSGNIYIWSIFQ